MRGTRVGAVLVVTAAALAACSQAADGTGTGTGTSDRTSPGTADSTADSTAAGTVAGAGAGVLLDDFDPPPARDAAAPDGSPVGLHAFAGDGEVDLDVVVPDVPRPGDDGGAALRLTARTGDYAGALRVLGDGERGWQPLDATAGAGLALWLRGEGEGAVLFVDVLGPRTAGSTVDDAGRWTAYLVDDEPGWRRLSWAWGDLERKDVGNGAPTTEELDPGQLNGWAVGVVGGAREQTVTVLVDDVRVVDRLPAETPARPGGDQGPADSTVEPPVAPTP